MKIQSLISPYEGMDIPTKYASLEKARPGNVFFLESTGAAVSSSMKAYFMLVKGKRPKKGHRRIIRLKDGEIWEVKKDRKICFVDAHLIVFSKPK